MEADLANGFWRVTSALKGLKQAGGVARTTSEFGHSLHRRETGHRHNASHDGNTDPRQIAAFSKIVEIPVFEKELGANVIGSGVHLGFEIVHFKQAIGCGGMSLWKSCDANTKSSFVGVTAEFFDEANQINGLRKRIARVVVVGLVARRVTAEGQDITDSGGGVAFQNRSDLRLGVADAGEVRYRVKRRGSLEPKHEFVGELARRAAGPIGHANKVWLDFFEIPNRRVELFLRLGRFRREELEGDGGLAGLENVADVHEREF